jgi:hypothetical protein
MNVVAPLGDVVAIEHAKTRQLEGVLGLTHQFEIGSAGHGRDGSVHDDGQAGIADFSPRGFDPKDQVLAVSLGVLFFDSIAKAYIHEHAGNDDRPTFLSRLLHDVVNAGARGFSRCRGGRHPDDADRFAQVPVHGLSECGLVADQILAGFQRKPLSFLIHQCILLRLVQIVRQVLSFGVGAKHVTGARQHEHLQWTLLSPAERRPTDNEEQKQTRCKGISHEQVAFRVASSWRHRQGDIAASFCLDAP